MTLCSHHFMAFESLLECFFDITCWMATNLNEMQINKSKTEVIIFIFSKRTWKLWLQHVWFYSLYTGIPQTTLSNSQRKTQSLGTKKRGHISLEWLSIMARIDLKILIYVYKAVSGLSSTLHYWTSPLLLSPTRMLRTQLLLYPLSSYQDTVVMEAFVQF